MERVANDGDIFWQDNDSFVDDGIQIEPFNLNKEREEGYFDADGNFVEYVNDNEIKVKRRDFTRVHFRRGIVHVCWVKMDSCRMHGLIVLRLNQNMLEKGLL